MNPSPAPDGPHALNLKYEGIPPHIAAPSCGPECPYCAPSNDGIAGGACPSQRLYGAISVGDNQWIRMACQEAVDSVREGGGPFGAILVQIEDATGRVLRYWRNRNRVTALSDPTAHAEICVLRAACRDLGVFHLGLIHQDDSGLKLPQNSTTSHCEIYSSCEPCPMCYAAIRWARINTLVFAATRFDAAEPGVDFSDLQIYEELETSYADRQDLGLMIRRSVTPASREAFELWQKSENRSY